MPRQDNQLQKPGPAKPMRKQMEQASQGLSQLHRRRELMSAYLWRMVVGYGTGQPHDAPSSIIDDNLGQMAIQHPT